MLGTLLAPPGLLESGACASASPDPFSLCVTWSALGLPPLSSCLSLPSLCLQTLSLCSLLWGQNWEGCVAEAPR